MIKFVLYQKLFKRGITVMDGMLKMSKKHNKNISTDDKERIFRDLPVPAALKAMIIPAAVSQIIVLIYNMADTFYVGQVNDPYMVAATSLILPLFNITLCLAGLAGTGGGALISSLLGQDRPEEAKRVASFSIWLAVLIAAVFSISIGIFNKPLLNLLGASDKTFTFARQYAMCVLVAGGIPTVLSNVLSNLIRSVGRSKEAGAGIILGGVLNIILDPIFMFIILPDGLEVFGAGLATCISNIIACIYFLIVLYGMGTNRIISFDIRGGLPLRQNILMVFSIGVPSAVATFLFDLDYVIIDKLMVSYHDLALAAIGIVLKVERFPLNVGIGICQGMLPLVAFSYASGNKKRMNDLIRLSRLTGLIIAAVSILLYEIFAAQFIRIFIADPETVAMAEDFLRIRVLATPFMFLSFFTVYLFQAFKMGDKALISGVTRWLVLNIPMLFILNAVFGMYGIVASQVTADILNTIICFMMLKKYAPS